MPSAIEIPNHQYHVIKHNLQETKIRKEKKNVHKSFPAFSINYRNFCHLLLSTINIIVTSN
jgi:predicted transcriptional regulator YdeE